jgi:hypothetical protein
MMLSGPSLGGFPFAKFDPDGAASSPAEYVKDGAE